MIREEVMTGAGTRTLQTVRDLVPPITTRSAEIEAVRRIPPLPSTPAFLKARSRKLEPHWWQQPGFGPSLQSSNLSQHCSLIPVNPLGRHLAVTELDDNDQFNLNPLVGRRHAGQEPLHLFRMAETGFRLFNDRVLGHHPIRHSVFPF